MIDATHADDRRRMRLRQDALLSALLSATVLATGLLAPAQAAQFGIVVNQVADPLMSGLPLPDNAPTAGLFSGVKDWPMNAIHLAMMPSGRIVSYGTAAGNPGVQDGRTFTFWDPSKGLGQGTTTYAGIGGVNSFCSAQALRTDGSLMTSGGIFDNGNDKGSLVVRSVPNGANGAFAVTARLANDRYYSTMLTLPNGQQLIMGGSYPYQGGWADPQGSIDKGLMTGMTPEIYDGTQWRSLFSAKSRDAFGPENSRWWYPRAWVAPNGKVFGISAEKMWFLDPSGNGAVTAMNFKEPQRNANSATDAPNVGPVSTAAMYETGKILQVGGNSYDNGSGFLSSSRASIIDINTGNPVVTDTNPMSVGRAWANATVLPTGQVAVTGGSKFNDRAGGDTVLQTEIWDPKTGRWSVGASGGVYRGYHSTAILMQNGALLIAGGGAPGPVNNQNAEVYYPPYLFTTANGKTALAPRPQIVSLNTVQLQHGGSLQFELTSPNGLSQVVLVGLSAVTHSFNSGQRRIVAGFSQNGTAVTMQAPGSANVAPPGYYQVVAIDQKGVPSPGVIIALGAGVAAPGPVAAPAVPAATAAAGGTTGTGTTAGGTATGGTTGTTAGGTATGGTAGTGTTAGGTTAGGTAAGGTAGGAGIPAATGQWTQIGIAASRVSIGADGTLVTLNADNRSAWRYVSDNNWVLLPGAFVDIAVLSATSMYAIGTDTNVYRYNGQNWTLVGTNAKSIAAAGGTVFIANGNNDIWLKQADDNTIAWTQLPGKALKVAAMNGNSLWHIGTDNRVYRGDRGGNWVAVGGDAAEIAASADGSVVVTNTGSKLMWRKTGDNTVGNWALVDPNFKANAVTLPSAQRAIVVGLDRNIYRW
ncbi:Glyoxal oxidase N-terminus [Methylobacterium sp. 174MFSha1.1]|uniref:galactose oxidase-like domain-containing protein n=1 Tax=Methylobacterium sp. 174MFSha1.1 TaxID=1502749 RepID=UPI0008E33AA2|nr:galactose oxidase-like domain-containing protein [Methylobacterium sp. 174MFSha1.1]SFV17490.1 Glyoxal oxidase N-terminus [Methylobacterium sp. 174MFSha1.1]